MILLRHLGTRILGWILLALVLLLAFAVLAGVVEGARHGAGMALRLGLLEAPVVVLPLVPLACAAGAGLAAARLAARGEAVALQAMGVAPLRSARTALLVGLLLGGLASVAQGSLVPRAAASALALRTELGQGPPTAGWLWTGSAAVRTDSGARLSAVDGRLSGLAAGPLPDANLVRQAQALAQPSIASAADLIASDARPLVVEAWLRGLRPLACGVLAALAWLGLGPRGRHPLGTGLALALGWQALSLALEAQAAQGLLPAGLAVGLPILLLLPVGWALHRSRPLAWADGQQAASGPPARTRCSASPRRP